MRKKSYSIFIIICVMMCAILTGCSKSGAPNSLHESKNRLPYARTYEAMADSSKDGVYIQPLSSIPDLFYLDRETGKIVFLCGKADCEHGKDGNTECNAYFQEGLIFDSIQIVNDKLYVLGQYTHDKNSTVYRMDLDGSNREEIATVNAPAAAGAARIVEDSLFFIGMPDEGDFSAQHIYRQNLKNKENTAEDIFPMKNDNEKWASRVINEMFVDEQEKKLYFTEDRYAEDLTHEGAIWMYDISTNTFEEIFESPNFYTYFVDDEWVYYSEFEAGSDEVLAAPELTTFEPVKRWNYKTKETEETNIPGGFLCGYDGNYCYIRTYQDTAWTGVKSIDVYTLEGKLVESIETTVDDYQEYSAVNIGTTYDAIVMHHMRLDKPQTYISEDIYVYDKAMIGTGEGTWRKVAIDSWFNEKTNKIEIKITQEK